MWARPDTPGQYAFFNASVCPAGWVAANGTNGTVDLRGEFIRGWDGGRGVDPGRGLASWQADMFASHTHGYVTPFYGAGGPYGLSASFGNPTNGTTANTGGSETRPRNVALLACMKR